MSKDRIAMLDIGMVDTVTTPLWAVVLAGGAGRRLSGVTGGVPKQFWRGAHGPPLLEQTLRRFSPLTTPARTVVVIDAAHQRYLTESELSKTGNVIVQPQDRGTAAGVLLALQPVLDAEPDAIVALTPADHGVLDEAGFRGGLLEAARHVRSHGETVLFGVQPTTAHDDYGWITPGPWRAGSLLRPVAAFVEKPNRDFAAHLLASGAVWNTMVLVARASALRDMYAELLPGLARTFQTVSRLAPADRSAFLARVYPGLPRVDFSRDVLAHARNLSTYIWPASVGWSDLGTPERLRDWQSRADSARRSEAITAA
jgi:mannose-1-phosphate guanylyltransferase